MNAVTSFVTTALPSPLFCWHMTIRYEHKWSMQCEMCCVGSLPHVMLRELSNSA